MKETVIAEFPLSVNKSSKYGLLGYGGLMNEIGATYLRKYIGGSINFDIGSLTGKVTQFRVVVPLLDRFTDSTPLEEKTKAREATERIQKSLESEMSTYISRVKDQRNKIEAGLLKIMTEHSATEAKISSIQKLRVFLDNVQWSKIGSALYQDFPTNLRNQIGELFIIGTFLPMPGLKKKNIVSCHIDVEGLELDIGHPSQSHTTQTRIRVNQAFWSVICYLAGLDVKAAALQWLFFKNVHYQDNHMKLTADECLSYLAAAGQSLHSMDDVDLVSRLASLIVIMSAFAFTLSSVKDTEFFEIQPWSLFHPSSSDEQLKKKLETLHTDWSKPQIIIPATEAPPKMEMYLLPIGKGVVDNEPAITFAFLDTEAEPDARTVAEFVQIKTLNWTDDNAVQYCVFNKVTGSFLGSTPNRKGAIAISLVFPVEMTTTVPKRMDESLEPNHWELNFRIYGLNTQLSGIWDISIYEKWITNQYSFTGPHGYQINAKTLLRDIADDSALTIWNVVADQVAALSNTTQTAQEKVDDTPLDGSSGKAKKSGKSKRS